MRRYDVLVENLMDPAHLPYAHKGLTPIPAKADDGPDMGFIRTKGDPGRYALT
jgi:phenylpropionate dioxygenase-like ring-hydroxylating dioxygenase large terminal subunit